MPIPWVAIGAVAALTATAAAFLFDLQTDEESKRQDAVRGAVDDLRAQVAAARAAAPASASTKSTRRADSGSPELRRLAEFLRHSCRMNRQAKTGIKEQFDELASQLAQSLRDATLSAYRRNALRSLSMRLEDAQCRLQAYFAYCDWYLERVQSLEERARGDGLRQMAEPAMRLPEDWLYHGKVGLADFAELGGTSNAYGQKLELDATRTEDAYSDEKQRAVALCCPATEAIPVQVMQAPNKKNKSFFRACIVRGGLLVDRLNEERSLLIVESARTDGYLVRCFPAFCANGSPPDIAMGVRAFLPKAEMAFPGKRHYSGEQIEGHLLHADLLLTGKDITVTQHAHTLETTHGGIAPVFIRVDTARHDLAPLIRDAALADWLLRDYKECGDRRIVVLQLGEWRIDTEVVDCQLHVTSMACTGMDTIDLQTLPFPLRVIDQRLADAVHCDALRFHEFAEHCRQQVLFSSHSAERKAAGKFFDRWRAVTQYLIVKDGSQTYALSSVLEPDSDRWVCDSPSNLREAIKELTAKQQGMPRVWLEQSYEDAQGQQRWLQIGELNGTPDADPHAARRYVLYHAGIRRPTGAMFRPEQPEKLRLRYVNRGSYANLERQKRALRDFMTATLLNPVLQQILLDPGVYVPTPNAGWQQRVAAGLHWRNPDWQASDKAATAKQVVEAALIESNLYLMQGPPGTGKTTCIVEMLHQVFEAYPETRVLVVSQQNTAVDNALDRFLQSAPEFSENVVRLAPKEDKVLENLRQLMPLKLCEQHLQERQQAYATACLDDRREAEAGWIEDWLDDIQSTGDDGHVQFDDELVEILTSDRRLVGATCVGLASRRHGADRMTFDLCIVDEAGRATVPELLIPLMRSRKAILIGDHYQLPPSVASSLLQEDAKQSLDFLEDAFLKDSLFKQLYEGLPRQCRGRLVEQFRMAEPIGDLVADLFYSNDGERGLFNGKTHDRADFLDPQHCLRWVEVRGRQQAEQDGPSLFNEAEAEAMLHYLRLSAKWRAQCRTGWLAESKKRKPEDFPVKSVAIITPYGAQKRLIERKLSALLDTEPTLGEFLHTKIDTVDGFQGSEADIVLYSTVRTRGDTRFLLDRHRLNVACSRARENLVFFGNAGHLRSEERRTGKLLFSEIIGRSEFTAAQRTAPVASDTRTRPKRQPGRRRATQTA